MKIRCPVVLDASRGVDFNARRPRTRRHPRLGRHHRKAAALFTSASRFHYGVQRQDVGLECDTVDDTDDADDFSTTHWYFLITSIVGLYPLPKSMRVDF
jgi:hypothetical protein